MTTIEQQVTLAFQNVLPKYGSEGKLKSQNFDQFVNAVMDVFGMQHLSESQLSILRKETKQDIDSIRQSVTAMVRNNNPVRHEVGGPQGDWGFKGQSYQP